MIRYNKLTAVLFFFAITLFFTGCVKKDFDTPPVGTLPVGTVYTISELRQMYVQEGSIMIDYDASVYAVVTMDESSGNIYKSAFIQDGSDAVNLHKTSSGGLRIGDSVRVYLKKVVLSEYGGMFQLDNINPDSNIVILGNQKYKQPALITISDLSSGDYEGKLIRLENVQFSNSSLGKPYADPDASANRTLEDCNGNLVTVRTSNYATFAEVIVPDGKGDFVAIASVFNEKPQLVIRSLSEINLKGDRCDGGGGGGEITPVDKVDEKFDDAVDYDDIDFEGWTNIKTVGNRVWTGKSFSGNKYAQATGYNSGLGEMETWMITPPVINTSGDLKLSFKSAMAYWSHNAGNVPLTVLASTDYDGTNFETATWTDISDMVTIPDANSAENAWLETVDVSLAAYTGNVCIAFKYNGSEAESTSIRIDDVIISGDGGGGGGDVLPSLNETFDDYVAYDEINKNGWVDLTVAGDRLWIAKEYDGNNYAQATGYNSELDDMETWMITPLVDNTSGDKTLTFKAEKAYWKHSDYDPMEVYVSTDFNGTNFESANWTKLSPTLPVSSDDDYAWIESGDVDLSAYVGNVAVAFRYKGSNDESTSIQVDDVVIE